MLTVLLLCAATHIATAQTGRLGFPGRLESYLTNSLKLSTAERQRLIKGEPLTKMLKTDASKEVAVFGAVWISAPISRYVEAVKDIEGFERGTGFKVTKRIGAPPRLEDFSELRLPDEDIWTGLELRVLVPDPPRGSGFWFVTVNRSRSEVSAVSRASLCAVACEAKCRTAR
jgi:hypothetical protein